MGRRRKQCLQRWPNHTASVNLQLID